METVLGIDLGTSYFKLGLFDREGELRGLGRVPVEKSVDDGRLCEIEVDRFWGYLRSSVLDACAEAGVGPKSIRGVCYSSQANTFLLLDEKGSPLTPLVVWTDRRAAGLGPVVDPLYSRDDFLETTGLGVDVSELGFPAKLLWYREREPELWDKARSVMTISDYLTWSLTNRRAGDSGTAALSGLVDLKQKRWWREPLSALELDESLFPELLPPGTVAGDLSQDGAKRLGLSPGTPLAVGSLDHHIAAIGAGAGSVAETSCSIGTVAAAIRLDSNFRPRKDCCAGPGIGGNGFWSLTFDENGASALEWYRKNHAPDLEIAELGELAGDVSPGCDGLSAHRQPQRFESLSGFDRDRDSGEYGHGHYARAIMESVGMSLARLISDLAADRATARIVATGGGARSDVWLQIMADVTGIEFVATACPEPACRGAAMLAGVAAGWFLDPGQAASEWISVENVFAPDAEAHRAYVELAAQGNSDAR